MDNSEIEKEIIEEKKSIFYLRAFLFVSVLAVTACFGVFYYSSNKHVGRQMVEASVFDARLQNIENSVMLHEKRLATLEDEMQKLSPIEVKQPSASAETPAAAPPADVTARLDALEKEIKAVKAVPVSGSPEQVARAITLLTSFHRLGDNVLSGRPFASELSAFQENYGNTDNDKQLSDALNALAPYAAGGVPTVYRLLTSFDKARDSLKVAEPPPAENAGFTAKLLFNLSQMVSIHRIDRAQTGTTPDAAIERAQGDLDNEAVEAAIAEIKSLPEKERSSFETWLEDAQMAAIAPSLVDQIEEKTMKKAFATTAQDEK